MKEKKKKKIQIWFKFIYVDIENIEEYKGKRKCGTIPKNRYGTNEKI